MKPIENKRVPLPKTAAEYLSYERACGLKEGDRVLVIRRAENYAHGWDNSWVAEMDDYIGCINEVLDACSSGAGIEIGCFRFPYFVLEKVD